MSRMFPEIYEALRSVMPEEKAIKGAVRLTEAVLAFSSDRTTDMVRYEVGGAATTTSDLEEISKAERERHNSFRLTAWLLSANVVLMIIACVKVFVG